MSRTPKNWTNFKPCEGINGKTELASEHVQVGNNTKYYNGVSVYYAIVFRQASMILMIWRTHNALKMEK
jgi:hypothetical protein